MPDSDSQTAEAFDSTAKLMLEALAKASSELEKTVEGLYEMLISSNRSLQVRMEEEIKNIEGRLEESLNDHINGLSQDKEQSMRQLRDILSEQVGKLEATGHDARDKLSQESTHIVDSLDKQMNGRITEVKDWLAKHNELFPDDVYKWKTEIPVLAEQANKNLLSLRSQQELDLRSETDELTERLESQTFETNKLIADRLKSSAEMINTEIVEVLAKVKSKYESSLAQFEQRSQFASDAVSKSRDKARADLRQVADDTKKTFDQVGLSFEQSLTDMSSLLTEMYDARLQQISAQAKGEIFSTTTKAKEQIATRKAQLASSIRDSELEYTDKFESLFRKLSATINELSRHKKAAEISRGFREERHHEQLRNLFRRFGKEVIDTASNAARQLETDFQLSVEGFEQRVENARASAVELLEREERLMKKELDRSMADFEKQKKELEDRIDKIEKAGQDAAITVMTYRRAMLDFSGE